MVIGVDLWTSLDHDVVIKILMCLEDVSDLVRFSSVSRSWRRVVIANVLCKDLCFRMFPELASVDHVSESYDVDKPIEAECSKNGEMILLEKEHRVYSFLARCCRSFYFRECISDAIMASSTDNYPQESIHHTLHMEPRDEPPVGASYWSSEGQRNPAVSERLTYKLLSRICVITDIYIQPFQACFQMGFPVYSAKSVRFRVGYSKYPIDVLPANEFNDDSDDDQFVWTYTSQEFPMVQVNRLQNFKLPQPVLCIGGILQIELLGRVQTQEVDGLFYICIARVRVRGQSLSPAFDVEIVKPTGEYVLKALSYNTEIESPSETEEDWTEGDDQMVEDYESEDDYGVDGDEGDEDYESEDDYGVDGDEGDEDFIF